MKKVTSYSQIPHNIIGQLTSLQFLSFSDKIDNNFTDPGKSTIENILKQSKKITLPNIQSIHSEDKREILTVNIDNLEEYVDEIKRIADESAENNTKKVNLIADYVYYHLNKHLHDNVHIENEELNISDTKTTRLDEFINKKVGVCRHRSILFKYLIRQSFCR